MFSYNDASGCTSAWRWEICSAAGRLKGKDPTGG